MQQRAARLDSNPAHDNNDEGGRMHTVANTSIAAFEFGAFRLLPARRVLLAGGQPVKLGSRAFDLLVVLVEQQHRLVTKQELLELVWPDNVVEEANLPVHILALRKVLGKAAIATVPGRGYRFMLEATATATSSAAQDAPTTEAPEPARGHLPQRFDALFGREQELDALQALVRAHGLVTVVGSAGVGKTRLALALARRMQPAFEGGAWWIELAALADPGLVAVTATQVLRIAAGPQRDAATAVATVLRRDAALLVLDNAEHVVPGVIELVAAVRELAPNARLLVTSQLPLRAPAEQLLRLSPLTLPATTGLASARSSGAVALFEARANLLAPGFRVNDSNHGAVVDICRRLDGIPLAIELAAARLPLLGLDGLRERLDERFRFLASPARSTLPRHQTLTMALEWSHSLLDANEQRVLRRLGVFVGGFSLALAQRVAADEALDAWGVLDVVGWLIDKSLVASDGRQTPRLHLLETTRFHALERLEAAGEDGLVRERHARALDHLFTVAEDDHRLWRTPPAPPEQLVCEVDNARAALRWAQSCSDDTLAVHLCAGASHAFLAASLNAEYLQHALPMRNRVQRGVAPRIAGLFWARIALASSRNAHPAGLEAARHAAEAYQALGDAGRLYDALTWLIAIGSRHAPDVSLQEAVTQAAALEQAAWPATIRSSFQWAKHRWLLSQGRIEEALVCAQAQAELLAQAGSWLTHVALGANVADCELALGRLARAEALSSAALEALDVLGIDENLVGHVMDMLMLALSLQGRDDEAIAVGQRALRLLEREGDELRLLDTLALNATTSGRWADAALIAGYVDAAMVLTGEQRWPTVAARRELLERRLEAALTPRALARHFTAGAALTRDAVFGLALRAGPAS
jgi:predicted ATPase/DNA-binding winged helix-turn-helix (wHTH) protein